MVDPKTDPLAFVVPQYPNLRLYGLLAQYRWRRGLNTITTTEPGPRVAGGNDAEGASHNRRTDD